METWDAIRARRNVRQYTDQPIPRDDLERILEAGRRSPSSSNWQPWHFVVVTDREQLVELAMAWGRGGAHIARSAATIALVAQQPEDEQIRQRIAYPFGQASERRLVRRRGSHLWGTAARSWGGRRPAGSAAGRLQWPRPGRPGPGGSAAHTAPAGSPAR